MRGSRQIREEQLVDNPCPCDAHRTLLVAGWMGRHDHAAPPALGSHWDLRTIVKAARHLAFRALLKLISWEVQTRLHKRMIEIGVDILPRVINAKPAREARTAPVPYCP